jgi:hypothetical protein
LFEHTRHYNLFYYITDFNNIISILQLGFNLVGGEVEDDVEEFGFVEDLDQLRAMSQGVDVAVLNVLFTNWFQAAIANLKMNKFYG